MKKITAFLLSVACLISLGLRAETLQEMVDAAENGAVIEISDAALLEEGITVRGKAVEIRSVDYNTAATPTLGLRVNYMDQNKISAQTIIYFRKPVTNTSTPTEVDRLIVGDFEAGIEVLTAINAAEAVRYIIGIHDDITLTKDIVLPDGYGHYLVANMNVKVSCTFDLNGHTLTQTSGAKGGWSNLMLFDATCDWTIPGVETMTFTLKDSKKTGAIYVPLHAVNANGKAVVNIEDVKIVYGYNCTEGDVTQDNKSGGQAIVVVTANNGGTVNLKGDTSIVRDENCILTGQYPWVLLPYEGTTINVESGYYEGLFYSGSPYGTMNITGGTFKSDYVYYFVADGYAIVVDKETGLYTVKEAVAKIVDGEDTYYYATLQDAMDDTVDGDTVTLLKDIELKTNPGISVNGTTKATLDLNGHEIHGYAYANTTSYVIYNLGVLTITDSSEAKSGAIIAEATDPDMKSVPGYANNAITNYGHLTLDGVYVYAAGTGNACYAVDNDAENAQWRTTCYKDSLIKIVYLKIINGAKLRTAASSTVRQYLDSDEIWWNVVEMDGADMGSFWLQDNYQKTTGKGFYARGMLSIKNSSFIYAVNLGYWNVAGYVDVTLENSTFTSVYNDLGQYFINGYPGKVSVKNCRFRYNFAMEQPVKCLTDGLYGNAPVDDVIVEGYEVAANEDPETKATYPHIVRPIPVVEFNVTESSLPIKVQEKQLASIVGDEEILAELKSEDPDVREAAEAKVEEKLHTKETNGLEVWQNYVLGINGTTGNLGVTTEDNSTNKIEIVLATDPMPNSGFTVSYAMDYTAPASETTTLDTLDIDLTSEDPTGVYQVKAILTPENGGEPVVIETQNKVGVIKAQQNMEVAIVAVPWKKLSLTVESEDIPVADLVKTTTLDQGDRLLVYNGVNYDAWKLTAQKTWESIGIIVKTEAGMELISAPDPDKTSVKRGSGVFLQRKDPSKPYYLYGQVDEEEVVEALTDKINLVANPNLTAFDLNAEGAITAAAGDTIIVPTEAAPKKCTKLGGKWGYQEHYIDQRGIVRERRVETVKIPAGTGFWYEKGDKSNNSKIEWSK